MPSTRPSSWIWSKTVSLKFWQNAKPQRPTGEACSQRNLPIYPTTKYSTMAATPTAQGHPFKTSAMRPHKSTVAGLPKSIIKARKNGRRTKTSFFACHLKLSGNWPHTEMPMLITRGKGFEYNNEKGCYLANAFTTDRPPCKDCPEHHLDSRDGGFFTVVADAYFPNSFGLYNTSGNVAEMVMEPGVAKGGSWEDTPENCKISSRKKYSAPSPAVGFRVFMEVK